MVMISVGHADVMMITIVGLQETTANKLSSSAQEASLPHHIGQVTNSITIIIVIVIIIVIIMITKFDSKCKYH